MKTTTQLVNEVSAILKDDVPTTEANRFKSMDICQDIMATHDELSDDVMRETLRSWVGKVQAKFQGGIFK